MKRTVALMNIERRQRCMVKGGSMTRDAGEIHCHRAGSTPSGTKRCGTRHVRAGLDCMVVVRWWRWAVRQRWLW